MESVFALIGLLLICGIFVMKHIFYFSVVSIMFLLFDFTFFSAMNNLFVSNIEKVQNSMFKINYGYTALTYLILIIGYYYFVILKQLSPNDAFILGLFVYGVYEGTNIAIFKNWSPYVALIDTIWGGVLFGAIAIIVYDLQKRQRYAQKLK